MGRYTREAQIWVGLVTGVALLATLRHLPALDTPLPGWLALGLLALCAALAHAFPIRAAATHASYPLTNLFLVAGAVILPPGLLTPLALLAITPATWRRWRRPGLLPRWLFNVAQTVVALHAMRGWLDWTGAQQLTTLRDLAALVAAAALFALVQALLVGVIIALSARTPLHRAETFALPALLADGLLNVLGILVAGLWLAKPLLLLLVPAVLLIAHRLTRTAHLAHLAQVDTKTGLHNFRHFEQVLEEELPRSQRLGRPLALLFADLDHFKQVNDRHGHAAGDEVLRSISTLLAGALRKGDVLARFGGEEFVALLPGTEAEAASALADRLRCLVEQHPFVLRDGTRLQCTISIGVAAYPEDGSDLPTLLRQADQAMYRAKQRRNTVAQAGALPSVPRLAEAPPPRQSAPPAARLAAPPPTLLAPVLLWSTVVGGLLAASWSLVELSLSGRWALLVPFLLLALGAECLTVQVVEANRQKISLSFTIAVVMAAVTVLPPAAPLVNVTAALVHVVQQRQWRKGLGKPLFNLANPALAASMASLTYQLLRPAGPDFTAWHLAAALAAVLAYSVTNVGLIALMISVHTARPFAEIARQTAWFSPTTLLLGLTGAFLGGVHAQLGLVGALMFTVPVLVMRFTLAFYAKQSQQAIATLRAAKTEVEQAHQEQEETLRQLIEMLASIIDARDNSVWGHSRNVAQYAVALGEELQLAPRELAYLHTAGLLHDLGKVVIPEAILHKPGRLTAEEYAVVQQHAATGERILGEVRPLAEVARMVGDHHERYEGRGYPRGERGEAITLGGRILAVADTLDSILSDRPYAPGKPLAWALAELDRCAGTQFDPTVVAALRRLLAARGAGYFHSEAEQDARAAAPAAEPREWAGTAAAVLPFPGARRHQAIPALPR